MAFRTAWPERPCRSPTAKAAGTTAQPGWNRPARWESSVSSAWAAIPLARAALIAVVRISVPQTVASGVPPWDAMKPVASRPARRRDPEMIAASVSIRWHLNAI